MYRFTIKFRDAGCALQHNCERGSEYSVLAVDPEGTRLLICDKDSDLAWVETKEVFVGSIERKVD